MLSLLDIISMSHIITIFVIVILQTVVLIWRIGVHMIYHPLHTKFHVVIITMKLETKEKIYTSSILLFYIIQKTYCTKDSISFWRSVTLGHLRI
jgi:hypothetical protein